MQPNKIHLTEEDQILLYYGEPGVDGQARAHLVDCPECRAAAEQLANTLSVCNEWAVPTRPADFERDVWNRLVPELDHMPVRNRRWQVLAAVAGFAVLLLAVFFAGRLSRTPETPVLANLSEHARERVLAIAVADHLERVQILLTEIANDGGAAPVNLATERDRAQDLVQEGRLMRQTLTARGETATAGFLDEVERILIETAHTPDGADAVRDLQGRIESGSLLFKARIVESNLRNEEQKL
jgi:hypothetical protein